MALRATSHGDLQALTLSKPPSLDNGMFTAHSLSSNNMGTSRFGKEGLEEIKGANKRLPRRPVRVVRPVSALGGNGTLLQISHLQGELVRKRKECEDLKKENKYLSNEIHMERIMMRTESELTMRNLRNFNQDLQAQVKELKQKLHMSQQRASVCSRAAEDAEISRSEAEKCRTLAEARALESRQARELAVAEKSQINEDLHNLSKEHANTQLHLAQSEKSYFETKLKLERASGEKQLLMEEKKGLEEERTTLRLKLKELTEENVKIREKEVSWRRRALSAEEQSERSSRAQKQAEQMCRLAEKERDDRVRECLSWREKHQALQDLFREQEDLKSQRGNKACQANIKSYFLCMTESDQRVKILKNLDGSPRNFTEGDPVYISTGDGESEDSDKGSGRTMLRVAAPRSGRDSGAAHFSELPPMGGGGGGGGGDATESGPLRRSRKVVEYFWIPTDEE